MTFNVYASDIEGNNRRFVGTVSSRKQTLAYEHALRKFQKDEGEVFTLKRKQFRKYFVVHFRHKIEKSGRKIITSFCMKRFNEGASEELRVTGNEALVTCSLCKQRMEI
jgi:hypothetical protein